MIPDKYLPIGSVVMLKNGKKRIMITGFSFKDVFSSSEKIFDYIGCLYPEGLLNTTSNLLFEHSDISQVFYVGFSDSEEKAFKLKLNESLNKTTTN